MNDNNNQNGVSKVFGAIVSVFLAVAVSAVVFLIFRTM